MLRVLSVKAPFRIYKFWNGKVPVWYLGCWVPTFGGHRKASGYYKCERLQGLVSK